MNSIQVNLSIPIPLYNHLQLYIPNAKSNRFIVNAIQVKLLREEEKLKRLLKEGYQVTKKEDLKITKEFESVDFDPLDKCL